MNPFYRLSPFIQEYIWNHHWNELRDIQIKAIDEILDLQNHVIIAAGTASGKTEAAFFPILTKLMQQPVHSFGVLYIGPLKALINDQFERISDLLEEADFPIYAWHGDRPQSEKQRAKRQPQGVLQITPESLEGLLINHAGEAALMFKDLQFIIIDEIHAFMGTDRGLQLQCQLVRIDRLINQKVRRIGLSATINSYDAAMRWLSAGSERSCSVIESQEGKRRLDLAMQHYSFSQDTEQEKKIKNNLFHYLYLQSKGRKCLIFANGRAETEEIVLSLKECAVQEGEDDVFYAHHGSISGTLREETEVVMRESDRPTVVVATSTLELGIDLGNLDRVIQVGAVNSCSSFVQRLGRTGRRNNKAIMRFVTSHCLEDDRSAFDSIPWDLIQNIAIVQLYIEEHWVEPFIVKPCPFSVLFHQILAALMQKEMPPRELAKNMYRLPPFSNVQRDDYMTLIRHMLQIGIIEKTETGTLIPGLLGEKIASNYRFLSVFADASGIHVLHNHKEIGILDNYPKDGEIIVLAGSQWKVTEIDFEKRTISVVPSKGNKRYYWFGGGMGIDDRIIDRMHRVLLEDKEYPYLLPEAKAALCEARKKITGFDLERQFTIIDDYHIFIHPWFGSRKMETLSILLEKCFFDSLKINSLRYSQRSPRMYIYISTKEKCNDFWMNMVSKVKDIQAEDLISVVPPYPVDRYDGYIPDCLRKKAYVYNHMDIQGLKEALRQ